MPSSNRPHRQLRPVPLLTAFFATLCGLILLLGAYPTAALVAAVIIGLALTAIYLRGAVIR